MNLTLRTLSAIRACEEARDWFRRHYPRGLDLTQVTEAEMAEAVRAGLRPEWVPQLAERLPEAAARLCALVRADAVRAAAIEAGAAYEYAVTVDRAPRDDTRAAAIAERHGYWYAVNVDRCPRDDTRAAAIAEGYGYEYARDVDRCPRDDTRAAAIAERRGYWYAVNIDRSRRGLGH